MPRFGGVGGREGVEGNLRHSVPQLGNIAEDNPRMEVSFDVCLFKWDDFRAEQVAEVEGFAEVLPQIWAG